MLENEIQGRIRWSSIKLFISSALHHRTPLLAGLVGLTAASGCWSLVTFLSGRLADRILAVGESGQSIQNDGQIALHFAAVLASLLTMYLGNRFGRLCINATLIKSLNELHERAISAVLQSPMAFFNTNPSGRIVARFSNDFHNASQSLDRTMATFIYSLLAIFFSSIAILQTQPIVFLFALPVAFAIFQTSRVLGRKARDKQRSSGRAAASVLAHLAETGNIGVGVRALGLEEKLAQRMDSLQVESSRFALSTIELSNLRAFIQSLLGLMVIAGALVASWWAHERGQISIGQAGAIVTLLMVVLRNFVLVIELINTVELGFVSIERINEYAELPTEEASRTEILAAVPPRFKSSIIAFENVSVVYHPDHLPVLRNLTASMETCRMTGIVGRTGSGKSTLISALLRFVQISEGQIYLKGQNLAALPAREIRKKIALVPQDPILFSGDLFHNIIPGGNMSDDEAKGRALNALNEVGLSDWFGQLPQGLETELIERGLNLSQGQRQLVCLARALALAPELLVLDEATSAMDFESEKIVSAALQKIRVRLPILLIAHRPETIQSCDEVWLLKDGKIAWAGVPAALPAQEKIE
ncbi:MAG: ABC transporter ATP-binding protein [Silvanigrellaceae bacterium]